MINKAIQPVTTTDADILEDLDDIEHMAVELATLAGAEIVTTYGGTFTVRYKTGAAGALSSLRDPVSEIDRRVETLIRARLAERFPGHDVIGEEMEERPGRGQDCVWAVDPIDGTTNFVNGFPMFAASIGVLRGLVFGESCSASASITRRSAANCVSRATM
jgi:myo-inositol-1(or 4)-monophosphatase